MYNSNLLAVRVLRPQQFVVLLDLGSWELLRKGQSHAFKRVMKTEKSGTFHVNTNGSVRSDRRASPAN